MTWQEHKHFFETDGSLRDLFVFETDLSDWQKFLDHLSNSNYPTELYINRNLSSPINTAKWIFEHRQDIDALLKISVQNIQINCHFFDEHEIELDVEPREVDNEEKYLALVHFMIEISNLLAKPIILTPDNTPEFILLMISPEK